LTSSTTEWSGVLTGKLFEYLESGNGIIVLVKGVQDLEFERLMQKTGAGEVFYDPPVEEKALAGYLLRQYKSWKKTGSIEMEIDTAFIDSEMSWRYQAERMLKAIDI
jgi:hypothetical protein